jgi:glycosyltransferase involved in cell wall biosynthesis
MRRILVSAYGCEPGKGSEQGVGWHWVQEMARSEELWVITRGNNRLAIEGALAPAEARRIHFLYYDLPERWRWFKRREKGLYLYYALWQWGAYRLARRLATEVVFDYCMHLTFGSMWMPTFLHRLPMPFIWGPVGGGEGVPPGFLGALPWRGRLAQYARGLLVRSASVNPIFSGPARAARAVIARTEDSRRVFPRGQRRDVRVMLETGMSDEVLGGPAANVAAAEHGVELVYVGRLVASKNVQLAIRAVAEVACDGADARLTIVGDGPLRESLTTLARELGVLDRIRFLGAVSQAEAIQVLRRSHVFLFPSLKEGGAWALMEAMAVGLPVVCLDTSGMHVITDESCAMRIAPTSPDDVVTRMAEAVARLVSDPDLRSTMGANARRRVREHFLWSHKGRFIRELLGELEERSNPHVADERSSS